MSDKPEFYVQCRLRKLLRRGSVPASPADRGLVADVLPGDVYTFDMRWLPERYAVCGKWLKLKRGGVWQDHWQVVAVFSKRPAAVVEAHERDFVQQRDASDA